MPSYVIERKSLPASNEHKMHKARCDSVDNPETYAIVGVYTTSSDALEAARKLWPIQIKACDTCCT